MTRLLILPTILACLGWLTAANARAQETDADPNVVEARQHFDAGDGHYYAQRYALAAQEYQRSYDLLQQAAHPRASLVLFNVGRSLVHINGREADVRGRGN